MTDPRIFTVVQDDAISVIDHASVVKKRDQTVVGYAESERDGLLSGADQLDSGDVAGRLSGEPRRGESDTLVAA